MSELHSKKLLMLNGSFNEIPLIEAAHRFGFYVITSGNDPRGEGHAFADEYRAADYSDISSVLKLAKELQVHAICSAGNDLAALSSSYVAEALGLPGHDSFGASRVFHEKDEFRRVTSNLGMNVPRSVAFSNEGSAIAYAEKLNRPLLIKPVDLGGGKGISLVHSLDEAADSIHAAFTLSKAKRIVVEDYVSGSQHGFICYLKNGKVAFDTSTNDFSSSVNPWLVGSSFGHYADAYDEVRESIVADVELLASEVGASDGFLTIQYMLVDGRPCYLETMRRCLGNLHFAALTEETGVNWYEWFIASQAGLPCDAYIEQARVGDKAAGFIAVFAETEGTIRRITISDEFKRHVFHEKWFFGEGDAIDDHMQQRLGVVLFSCSEEERQDLMGRRDELIRVECF